MNISLWINYKTGSGRPKGPLLIWWPSSETTANDKGTLIRVSMRDFFTVLGFPNIQRIRQLIYLGISFVFVM